MLYELPKGRGNKVGRTNVGMGGGASVGKIVTKRGINVGRELTMVSFLQKREMKHFFSKLP